MTTNYDPKPGRWMLPLVVLAMVAFTYLFVRELPASAGGDSDESTTTTAFGATTTSEAIPPPPHFHWNSIRPRRSISKPWPLTRPGWPTSKLSSHRPTAAGMPILAR